MINIALNTKTRTVKCAMCGTEFETTVHNAKFCSDKCRKKQAYISMTKNKQKSKPTPEPESKPTPEPTPESEPSSEKLPEIKETVPPTTAPVAEEGDTPEPTKAGWRGFFP